MVQSSFILQTINTEGGQEDSLNRGRPPVQQDTVQGNCTVLYLNCLSTIITV